MDLLCAFLKFSLYLLWSFFAGWGIADILHKWRNR